MQVKHALFVIYCAVPLLLHVADSQEYCKFSGYDHHYAYCGASVTNHTFDYVPRISRRITYVDLNGQPLKQLPRNAFRNISSQTELVTIKLHRCQIQHIDVDAFENLDNLDYLLINDNKISHLETGTFQHTKKLRVFSMRFNKLEILQTGLFHNLIHLKKVDVGGNIITSIEQDTFRNTPTLIHINVEDNKLEYLSPLLMDNFINVANLYIKDNPWNCDCNLREFYEKNKARKNGHGELYLKCHNPPELRGSNWTDLIGDDFTCDARIISPKNVIRVVTLGSNVTLSCAVFADPPPDIEWYRNSKSIAKNKIFGSPYTNANMHYLNYTFTVQEEDLGGYYCFARNSANGVEANTTLTTNVTTK